MSDRFFLVLALALCSIGPPAHADAIDQNQPSGPTFMASFSQSDLAQSFQQSHGDISGAGILLQAGHGTSGTVTISLWDGLPSEAGTMLTSGSATGTQGQWLDIFWNYVDLTPGNTYYLVFEGDPAMGIAGDTSDPYPHGHTFANAGYGSFPDFDYAFRTYFNPAEAESQSWSMVKTLY